MPDAREMLKKLARGSRHKRVDIKVPDEAKRPEPLKKIKRTGATRPYQLVEAEESLDRSGAVAGSAFEGLSSTASLDSDGVVPECLDAQVTGTGTADEGGVLIGHDLTDEEPHVDGSPVAREGDTNTLGSPNHAPSKASEVLAPAPAKRRGKGETVTNLAKRSLIRPEWGVDLTRDEGFLRGYLREVFGKGKMAKEVDLYCQLYAEARRRQSISLHFLSAELGVLVGSSSNGTIRARLHSAEKLGLLVQQGFNNETKDHRRGTYIHLRCPWL